MEEEEKNPTPGLPEKTAKKRGPRKVGLGLASLVTCLLLVASILLTWTFTSLAAQKRRSADLKSQQEYYADRIAKMKNAKGDNLAMLDAMIEAYSLYADNLDEKAMLEAAFKAYVEATGDVYARYYTEAEYAELTATDDIAFIM